MKIIFSIMKEYDTKYYEGEKNWIITNKLITAY